MKFFLKGLFSHAIVSGTSMFFGLPEKVAKILDIALTDNDALGIAFVIGGVIGWAFIYLCQFRYGGPFLASRYISLNDASQQVHNAREKNFQDKNTIPRKTHLYGMWRSYPLYGKKPDSNVLIPVNNKKEIVERLDLKDNSCFTRFHKDISIKKTDFKKYLKSQLNDNQKRDEL